ncbi:MAG TPA: DUF1963 domain-containing protein, partial [Ktedonobacteraceae bacterium]|nr:DUF1963 domain-containing protein [Ktedonobacteraceae bacterium]
MQRSEIEQAFLKAGLKARIPAIEQLTRNSIRLSTTPVDEQQLAVGVSKLGGHPDLPPGISWPLLQGKPQAFLMQIRLADMQNFDVEKLLPPQGMLWFFYDATQETFGEQVQDRIGWRILFTPEPAPKLQRLPTPKGLPSASLFPSHALIPHSELTLALQPDLELPSFDWSEQEQEAYEQVLDMLHPPAERAQP